MLYVCVFGLAFSFLVFAIFWLTRRIHLCTSCSTRTLLSFLLCTLLNCAAHRMGIVPLCTDVCCVSSVVVRLAGLVGYVVWCASHLIMQADSI